jgi:hypothetical protein
LKVENQKMQKIAWLIYVASQGSFKDVKKYTKKFEPVKELGINELIKDHSQKFKKV